MKKNYFLGVAAAFGLLAFSSCSNDEDPILGPGEVATGEQVIVLDMQDTDVLSTKSRPLYSTENKGAELVTDVQLLVFGIKNESTYEFVKMLPSITNWDNASKPYNYGRKYEIKLTGNDKLSKDDFDKYIILAVGQDESKERNTPAPFKIDAGTGTEGLLVSELATDTWTPQTIWNVSLTPGYGFLKTKELNYNNQNVGEIFSGVSDPLEFTADGGFSTTVLLKRQVAGVLGYFSRIPSEVDVEGTKTPVTGIRLVSSSRNKSLDLSIALWDQADDATYGKPVDTKIESVVNGFGQDAFDAQFGTASDKTEKDANIVYEINLKDWFEWDTDNSKWSQKSLLPAEEGSDNDVQLLGNVAGWHNALHAANANVTVADGAVLTGEFVIPFDKTMQNTFELQLINTDETNNNNVTVLKTWKVKLDQLSRGENDGEHVYNIYRNHLYQIGKRGNGDNPTDPGTDPDKPQPLDKDQELIIQINDNWEFIHNMEIE